MGDPGLRQELPAMQALWPDVGGDPKRGLEADGATARLVYLAVGRPIPVARQIPDLALNHRLARGPYSWG